MTSQKLVINLEKQTPIHHMEGMKQGSLHDDRVAVRAMDKNHYYIRREVIEVWKIIMQEIYDCGKSIVIGVAVVVISAMISEKLSNNDSE
jgi:hypothetical protein